MNAARYAGIDRIIDRFRANGGLKHEFQAYKLVALASLLEQHKPNKILELGSGTTTAVFSDYIRNTPGSTLTVIDESPDWLENARNIADIPSDDGRFSLRFAPKVETALPEGPIARYDIDLAADYDFVLVDGPSLTIDGVKNKRAVNDNIIALLGPQGPKLIAVDIRRATVDAMRQAAKGYYEVMPSDLFRGGLMPIGYRYFTLFKRKH